MPFTMNSEAASDRVDDVVERRRRRDVDATEERRSSGCAPSGTQPKYLLFRKYDVVANENASVATAR
jgi:hypothetical protein